MKSPIVFSATPLLKNSWTLEHMDRNIREVEAESVALICCESLGLARCRIRTRLYSTLAERRKGNPNQSTRRAFSAPRSTILKAGNPRRGVSRLPSFLFSGPGAFLRLGKKDQDNRL